MNQDWEQRRQERRERIHERWGGHRSNPLAGSIVALMLIGGGLLFLLRNLGIVYFDDIGQYWPVILIAVGVSKLVSARGPHQVTTGLILGGIGTVFLLRNLGVLYGNVWGFIWPSVFIAIGLQMLVRNMYGNDWWNGGSAAGNDAGASTENSIAVDVVFGGIERKIVSQTFEGGKVAVLFGGADIDLRGAALKDSPTLLQADAIFGGVELRVPENWLVEVRGSGVFGGYEDRTHHPVTSASPSPAGQPPKLIVKGSAVFGGVEVRN